MHNITDLQAVLRGDLLSFVEKVFSTINPGETFYRQPFHQAIQHQLDQLESGNNNRLVINIPPRSLKSIFTSIAWPAWLLGHNPNMKIIIITYSYDLSIDLARQFRQVIQSSWYKKLFPSTRFNKDTENECITQGGGFYFATSVGGTLTGRGGDVIIIDDPIKPTDGMSDLAREKVITWYRQTLKTRLNNKITGIIVLVMQRVHMDDLSGYVLSEEEWKHLCLPAIAEINENIPISNNKYYTRKRGDILDPNREPYHILMEQKDGLGSFIFSAQYQQQPIPEDGEIIRREWFKFYIDLPVNWRSHKIVQSWDTACKEGKYNDFSVCTTWLVMGDGGKNSDYLLLDVLRKKMDMPKLLRFIPKHAREYHVDEIIIEDMGSGIGLYQQLKQSHALSNTRIYPFNPKGHSKTERAYESTPWLEAGKVFLPKDAPWLKDFYNEIVAFPNGRHDDQVDSMTQFINHMMSKVGKGFYITKLKGL